MADFLPAYEAMIRDEGGYKLTNDPVDRGGQTYAGIARKMNPGWGGWAYIDRGETPPTQLVRDFYRAGWWVPLCGDQLTDQRVAETLFNFAINTSGYGKPKIAIKLAQLVVGAEPDGDFGPKTLAAINAMGAEVFLPHYAIARIARRVEICKKDRGQMKFIIGWIDRDLRSLL